MLKIPGFFLDAWMNLRLWFSALRNGGESFNRI